MYVHLREMVNDPRVRTPPRNVCKFDMLLRGEEQSRGRRDGCELVARSSSKTTEPLSLIFPHRSGTETKSHRKEPDREWICWQREASLILIRIGCLIVSRWERMLS